MKSVILNLMMMGVASSLIIGDVSAISFGKSKSRTQQVQEEGTFRKTARKTKDVVTTAASKTKDTIKKGAKKAKEDIVSAKEHVKTAYRAKKDQIRDNARQKQLAKEQSPMNTIFESKAEIEYNLKYLNDVHKSLKTVANSVEKLSDSAENVFVVKSFLFELSTYVKLCDKFSEQYMEGMNKLKKAKQYDDTNYNLAMEAFTNAYETINYAKTQQGVVNYLRDLVIEENLKNVSEKDSSSISKKLSKLQGSLETISEDTDKLRKVIKSIDDQTIDKESAFKALESQMISRVQDAKKMIDGIPDMLGKVLKTVNNHINELQERADGKISKSDSLKNHTNRYDDEDFSDTETLVDLDD